MTATSSHAEISSGHGAARVAAVGLLFAGAADLVFLNTWIFPRLLQADNHGMVSVARVEQVTALPPSTSRQKVEAIPAPVPPASPTEAPAETAPPSTTEPPIEDRNLRPLRQVFFPRNLHAVDPAAAQALSKVARQALGERTRIVIDGHADQTGAETFNGWLSERRAAAVADQLIALGVPRERIVIRHFGSARPAVNAQHPQAMRRNRRVEIALAEGVAP